MRRLVRRVRRLLWILNGYFGRTLSLDTAKKVTVLITYYHPARMNNITSQVRNILKCCFVERVVVSNHNPEIRIEDRLNIRDRRLICMNQEMKRGCGYRWRIVNALPAEYFVVIDDDILLFPSQLRSLFRHLILAPEVPHGFSGMLRLENDRFQYCQRESMDVHYLCEIYAVTREHVERYVEMEKLLTERDSALLDAVQGYCDFMVISQTGNRNPKIHQVGRLLRHDTFDAHGFAVHKKEQFGVNMIDVSRAVEKIRSEYLVQRSKSTGR